MNSIKKQIIYLVIINSIPKAVGRKLKHLTTANLKGGIT